MSLRSELDLILASAATAFAGGPLAADVATLLGRLDGPLRVAIAGRVKAGKSTLLNALVGERLAPTDARECTRIVTWYRYGDGYDVEAEFADGALRPLRFSRSDGRLEIELDPDEVDSTSRLLVAWPSSRLRAWTIIDTPGLGSTTTGVSERTTAALAEHQNADGADAVIYLMRHMHATDAAFLETFLDAEASASTPVNSIAVLSRADEIGGGRFGAVDSARAIARRYAADPRIRSLASAVVPLAGLLAETGATLEEHEAESLRLVAREPAAVCGELLLSVESFRSPDLGPLTRENRELLLARFGLYGIRLAVTTYRGGGWATGPDLARLLLAESGIGELEAILRQRFGARARQLVCRAVLESLRAMVLVAEESPAAADLLRAIEQLEASDHEIAELRMLDLVWSGAATFRDDERSEAERLTGEGTIAERAGCDPNATVEELRAAVIQGVTRWRERAADAFIDRQTAGCCETMARSYEGLYAETFRA